MGEEVGQGYHEFKASLDYIVRPSKKQANELQTMCTWSSERPSQSHSLLDAQRPAQCVAAWGSFFQDICNWSDMWAKGIWVASHHL